MRLRKVAIFRFIPKKPYNFELTVRKPAGWDWFTPSEVWDGKSIWTGFWFESSPIGLRAEEIKKGHIRVTAFAQKKLLRQKSDGLRRHLEYALGVNEDIRPFYRLTRKTRILRDVVRHNYGMREAWRNDIFSSLTLAVLLQMAPVRRSQNMWTCLIANYGTRINFNNKIVRLWPTAQQIVKTGSAGLAKKCKLGYRAKNLVKLAKQFLAGFPTMEQLRKMSPEEALDKLTELYGVGEYSAGFATPHPSFSLDVWSVKIFHPLIFSRPAPKKNPRSVIGKTTRMAEKLWGKWRSYVLTYVLNDLPHIKSKFGISAEGTVMLR